MHVYEPLFAASGRAPSVVDTDVPAATLALDGRLIDANDALCRLAGRRHGELVGQYLRSLTAYPTDAQLGQRALVSARGGTSCGSFTQRWVLDDELAPLRVVLVWTLVRDAQGTPDHLSVFVLDETRDNTDAAESVEVRRLREAERAAGLATARMRAQFDQSPVAQVLCDDEGRVAEVNAAFCRLVGRTAKELVGRPAGDLLHRGDQGLVDLLGGPFPESGVTLAERVLAHGSGTGVQAAVTATALCDRDGSPAGVLASFQDLGVPRRAAARRERQESFFLALAQRAGDLVVVTDAEGLVLYASQALADLVGWSPEDLTVLGSSGHVHREDLAAAGAAFARVLGEGVTETVTLRARDTAGEWHWMEATGSNLLRTAVGGVLWNLRDIDDRVRAEAALRASESRYRAIADNAEEGLWVFGPDGATVYANNRLAEILGLDAAELGGHPVLDLLDRGGRLREGVVASSERRSERYETDYQHPDGRLRTLRVSAAPLDDVGGSDEGFLAMVSDVTDARRLEHELRRAALHDSLTGLPNRALLFDRLEHALMRETRSTAVLFVDIDRFKMVNDVWGHTVGDELLVRVGTRLQAGVRPTDTVARFAGDEFLVVCEDVDDAGAHHLATELLAALDAPFEVSEGEVRLTASIGVATSPAASAQELLGHADSAMYAAKAAGRHRVRDFDSALASGTEERQRLGGDLRRALDDDELTLHHQPVVDLRTGRVVGTEALARWTHPQHGVVSPDRFVPVAEQVGLAPELDRWALRRALEDVRAMRAAGTLGGDSYVAVNVSAYTLCDPELDLWVAQTVLAAGFAPGEVLLEVTESAIMADATTAVGVLSRLRDRGFQIAVDDFGTGHSSLAYLRTLPVTMLKIDRTFVTEVVSDPSALAIATSIVDLARAVGLTVVAEGVETRQHAEVLQQLGCDVAQGWLWSRAVSPEDAATTGALVCAYPPACG